MRSARRCFLATIVVCLASTSFLAHAHDGDDDDDDDFGGVRYVNCNAGDSLADALNEAPDGDDPITFRVSGTCQGPFVIERDHVTLEGTPDPPAVLLGDLDSEFPIVGIRDSERVELRGLELRESGGSAVDALRASVMIKQTDIRRCRTGTTARESTIYVAETEISEIEIGAFAAQSTTATFANSVIEEPTVVGIWGDSSEVILVDTRVEGPGNQFQLGTATYLSNRCRLYVASGTDIVGNVVMILESRLDLSGSVQLDGDMYFSTSLFNAAPSAVISVSSMTRFLFVDDSTALVKTDLDARVSVHDVSRAVIDRAHVESLFCSRQASISCLYSSFEQVSDCDVGSCSVAPEGNKRRTHDAFAEITPAWVDAITRQLEDLETPGHDNERFP